MLVLKGQSMSDSSSLSDSLIQANCFKDNQGAIWQAVSLALLSSFLVTVREHGSS